LADDLHAPPAGKDKPAAGCLAIATTPFLWLLGANLVLYGLPQRLGWAVPRWLVWADGIALAVLGLVALAGVLLAGRGK
jgi:hypothetical protein